MSVVHKNLDELMKELLEFDSPGEGVVDEMEYRVFWAVLARDTQHHLRGLEEGSRAYNSLEMAWRVFEVVQVEWAAKLPLLGVVMWPPAAVGVLDDRLLKAYRERQRREAEKKKVSESAAGSREAAAVIDCAETGGESVSEVERVLGAGNSRAMSVVSAAPATATATATTVPEYLEEPPLFLSDFSDSEPAKAAPAGQKKSLQKRGQGTVEVEDEAGAVPAGEGVVAKRVRVEKEKKENVTT